MKKIKKISIIVTCILIVGVIITLIVNNNKTELKETSNDKKSGMFSFMLEKKDGSGYEENSATSWPSSDEYIFNPILSKCERGSKLKYDLETNKVQVTASGSDKCYLYFDTFTYERYCKVGTEDSLVCDILRKKDNSLIYHDGLSDYDGEKNVNLETKDLSYRFVGKTPNNYVCLDNKTDGECANEDLYRIIGLFDNDGKYETKLIMHNVATTKELGKSGAYSSGTNTYVYNNANGNGSTNMWRYSNLNNVNLNDFYYNYIIDRKPSLEFDIVKHDWVTGGTETLENAGIIYGNELGKNKLKVDSLDCYSETDRNTKLACTEDDLIHKNYIALMYVSDYMYAATPESWNTTANRYNNVANNNWLVSGYREIFISRFHGSGSAVRDLYDTGDINSMDASIGTGAVRPTFYISSSVKRLSGNGTSNEPYRFD